MPAEKISTNNVSSVSIDGYDDISDDDAELSKGSPPDIVDISDDDFDSSNLKEIDKYTSKRVRSPESESFSTKIRLLK